MSTDKYRLLTRSDFDGLVCAILLKELDMLDEIKFVHPKDVQDGKIDVTERDIITNLPFVEGCHLCFDHHESEAIRNYGPSKSQIKAVVWNTRREMVIVLAIQKPQLAKHQGAH